MIPAGAKKQAELLFYHTVVEKIEKHSISDALVINFDQTPSTFFSVA